MGAKVVAIGALLALATAVAGALCWIYTAILFEPLPAAGFAAAVGLIWLSLAVFAALTFLASVTTRSALVAGGIGVRRVPRCRHPLGAAGRRSLHADEPVGRGGRSWPSGPCPTRSSGRSSRTSLFVVAAVGLAWWSFRRQEI